MDELSVVTVGGGVGLGLLLADMAVAQGAAAIGIIDVDELPVTDALGAAVAVGVPAAATACDIRTSDAAHAAFTKLATRLGRVDTVINCAAIFRGNPFCKSPTPIGMRQTL